MHVDCRCSFRWAHFPGQRIWNDRESVLWQRLLWMCPRLLLFKAAWKESESIKLSLGEWIKNMFWSVWIRFERWSCRHFCQGLFPHRPLWPSRSTGFVTRRFRCRPCLALCLIDRETRTSGCRKISLKRRFHAQAVVNPLRRYTIIIYHIPSKRFQEKHYSVMLTLCWPPPSAAPAPAPAPEQQQRPKLQNK